MAYIGRQAGQLGNYIRCNTITPNGAATTFALTNVLDGTAVAPGSENNVLCSVSGVMQAPGSGNAFTIDGTNIVFSEAPDSTDTVDFVIVIGTALSIGTPSTGTVGMNELSATGTKDATTFLRGDNSFQVVSTDVVGDTTPQLGGDLDAQGNNLIKAGYVGYRSPDDSIVKTITVTVASKTTEHYHHGTGSSNGYLLDGVESPALTLAPGKYRFDQADGTNSGHPLLFYSSWDKSRLISTGVTTNGTPGSAGAYTELEVDGNTATPLYYQCSAHAYMGHLVECIGAKQRRINNSTDKTNTGDGSATTVTCLAGTTVDDVLVFVNGICLVPTDDYTISGTTLTFVTAPANTAEIVLRYLG